MSALPPEADMLIVCINVCFVPIADIRCSELSGLVAQRFWSVAPPTSLGSSACLSEHGLHSWSCSVARLLHFPGLCPWSFEGHRHFRIGCLSIVGSASDRSLLSAIMHYAPGLDACLAEPCAPREIHTL
jgi:hypothetical protein